MAITRSSRRVSAARIKRIAEELLETSTLCAIATIAPSGQAHINTAYFAWSRRLDLVWISEPKAKHSTNIERRESTAVAVFDSSQAWGGRDRGIQLFGAARKAEGAAADVAKSVYASRFPDYRNADLKDYHAYVFRPRRLKLFDESTLGGGVFVTASVNGKGEPAWERTELYRPA